MKLADAFSRWPPNTVVTTSWFKDQGISRQLLSKYCRSGWIERVEQGCFKKAGENIDWSGAVYALQSQLGLSIYPEAYTALQLHGISHHVQMKGRPGILLSGSPGSLLPRWFLRTDWGADISFRTTGMFPDQPSMTELEFRGNYKLKIPTRERAVLEVVDRIRDASGFEDAANVIESTTGLDPVVLRDLLRCTESFRLRRIFLFLTKYLNIPGQDILESGQIDLGSGVVSVVQGGKYVKEFGITVPDTFVREESVF